MASPDFTLEFPEGTDFLWEFTVTDQDDAAVDITAATITISLFERTSATDPNPTAVLTYSTADNVSITSGVGGIGECQFDAADTVGLAGAYTVEWELYTSLSKTYSKWGTLKITPRRMD